MNHYKRALISILRNKGKYTLLFGLLLIISSGIMLSFSIRQAVTNMENQIWAQFPPLATPEHDSDLFMEAREQGFQGNQEFITYEVISKISDLPYVSATYLTMDVYIYSHSLFRAPELFIDRADFDEGALWSLDRDHLSYRSEGVELEQFRLRGVNPNALTELSTGLISMEQGQFFSEEDDRNGRHFAVISRPFAEANSLEIGSLLNFENSVYDIIRAIESHGEGQLFIGGYIHDDFLIVSESITFEVKGIFNVEQQFEFDSRETQLSNAGAQRDLQNRIFIPSSLANELLIFQSMATEHLFHDSSHPLYSHPARYNTGIYIGTPIFRLYDHADIPAFIERANEYLPQTQRMFDFSFVFSRVASSFDNLNWLANQVLIGSIIASIIIVGLLITLFLRDRKEEIGIYLALGEKKPRIGKQLVLEVLIIALASLSLSIFSGNMISGHLSYRMIQNDLQAHSQLDFNEQMMSWPHIPNEFVIYSPSAMGFEDLLHLHDTSINPETIVAFMIVSIIIILISALIPILYTISMKPKKILM
ncbi:MAG: FtsX-like permease family protein [Turicibacter sp.]|nr:FtsX-like permease family protein [Turicibacter sp.]